MAALTGPRNTPELMSSGRIVQVGVEASTTIYLGSMVAIDANGYAVPAQVLGVTPLNALRVLGRCEYVYAGGVMAPGVNAWNLSGSAALFPQITGLGAAGAISVGVRRIGAFGYDNDSTISAVNIGMLAFAADDHTVSLADGSGATTVPNTTTIAMPAAAPLVAVLHPYIVPGSFNAYSATAGGGTHYVEGTDFAVDYQAGLFMALAGGAIAASGTVYVAYKYGAPTKVVAGTIVDVESGLVYVDFGRQALPSMTAAGLAN